MSPARHRQTATPRPPLCRWLAPHVVAVEELIFDITSADLGEILWQHVLPPAAPVLRSATIAWPGSLGCHVPPPHLPALTHLSLGPDTSVTLMDRLPNHLVDLPALQEFQLLDGALPDLGEPPAPWLPPTVTLLLLDGAGLRSLAPALVGLPRLRRCAAAG